MIQTFVLERVHLSSFPWLCVRLQDFTRKCPTGTNHTGGEFTVPKREFQNEGKPLVLGNIGWSRTERKSCFCDVYDVTVVLSLQKKIWRNVETVDQTFFKECPLLLQCNLSTNTLFIFVCRKNHIPPFLFRLRENDDDVWDIRKHDFRRYFTLLPMLPGTSCACVYYLIWLGTLVTKWILE